MTQDDQQFLDVLAGISSDVRKFTADIFEVTDKRLENLAGGLRDALSSASWLPQSVKPKPPPPTVIPESFFGRIASWISTHKAITGAILAFFGTGTLLIYMQRRSRGRKRRAKRADNGARQEVVVIAGPPSAAITKSIMLDLERRGFVVYCVVNTQEDESLVQNEGRTDLRPFHLDLVEPLSTRTSMDRFNSLLSSQHHAFTGARPHELNFVGLILVPDLVYPSGPIETLPAEIWSETLDSKVLKPIATVQALLPTICEFKSRILVLTPSIVASLRPPFHSIENTVVSALEGFSKTLERELSTLGIPVCQFKLGSFDLSNFGGKHHLQPIGLNRTSGWPATARTLYAQNFITQSRVAESKGIFGENGSAPKGSSLRELHHAVFDTLTAKHPRRLWRVGRGSHAYDVIGTLVPSSVIGWMLGLRRVSLAEVATPRQVDDASQIWEKVEGSGSI